MPASFRSSPRPSLRRRLRVVTEPPGNSGAGGGSESTRETRLLVAAAVAGERDAFDKLVRLTHRDAYGLALRLVGNEEDARDVVQEAYLRAFRGMKHFRGEAQFSTWLYRIVANCSATHLARRNRNRSDELPADQDMIDHRPDNDPALWGDIVDFRSDVSRAVNELPDRLRAVVVLRDIYDLPHEAIAAELDISVTAAKVRLHRARRRLRERLFPLPGDERSHAG